MDVVFDNCIRIGLAMDVLGVFVLFICTTTKKIEKELVYGILRDTTDRIVEWTESYSFQEHERKVSELKISVRRNRRFAKISLILLVAGFIFQLIGTYV